MAPKANRLAASRSLYLRQHGHNPVDWYPWGDEALTKARREDKMIFLSIGYSSCHWCHVMERESFENPLVAAILNAHFVSIKVDREERPDLDQIYMEAVQMMSGQGGWPLNVWLTPDLEPVYGGTYFPPEAMHSRPSFRMVLERLRQMWIEERDKLTGRAAQIRTHLDQDLTHHLNPADPTPALMEQAVSSVLTRHDEVHGGFGGAPKFPMAMLVQFMLRTDAGRKAALRSLMAMCGGGIYDQIGGGFHRYSTDEQWLVPHFEKMLYDQALLISALAEAIRWSDDPVFTTILAETGDFLDREMRLPDGGYGSALDADNDGVEGDYYTWTPEELARHGLRAMPNWEGRVILDARNTAIWSPDSKKSLLHARTSKTPPAFDPKRITAWNALLAIGFCDAYSVTGNEIWKQRATDLVSVLLRCVDAKGCVRHELDAADIGFANDHALTALALCRMHVLDPTMDVLEVAAAIGRVLADRFLDAETGTVYFAEAAGDRLVRRKDWFDHAEPSANSAAIAAFHKLGRLTGDPAFTRHAVEGIRRLHELLSGEAFSMGYAWLTASDLIREASDPAFCAVDGTCV